MPTDLSRDQVAAIAALANLQLDADETALFAQQLGAILSYADELQRVDTSGVPPTAAVLTAHPADRPDDVAPSLPIDATLANAPATDGAFFKVPRVIG